MIEEFTSKFLGKGYEVMGRGPDKYDCWGLCLAVCKEIGIKIPDLSTPETISKREKKFLECKEDIFKRLKKPKPYCLVAIKIGPHKWHAGVVLSDCWHFIHIMTKCSVVIERLDNIYWEDKIEGYYEYTG